MHIKTNQNIHHICVYVMRYIRFFFCASSNKPCHPHKQVIFLSIRSCVPSVRYASYASIPHICLCHPYIPPSVPRMLLSVVCFFIRPCLVSVIRFRPSCASGPSHASGPSYPLIHRALLSLMCFDAVPHMLAFLVCSSTPHVLLYPSCASMLFLICLHSSYAPPPLICFSIPHNTLVYPP